MTSFNEFLNNLNEGTLAKNSDSNKIIALNKNSKVGDKLVDEQGETEEIIIKKGLNITTVVSNSNGYMDIIDYNTNGTIYTLSFNKDVFETLKKVVKF